MSDFAKILLTITVIITLYLCYYIKKKFSFWKSRNVINPKPSFPFGNFRSNIVKKAGETIFQLYFELKKTGAKYAGYYLFTIPIFMPLDPELYKIILTKNFQNFHDHGIYYDEESDPMSAHLVSIQGTNWKNIRTKLSPAFSPSKIKTYFPLIQKCCKDLEEIIMKSETIDVHNISARYTTDVISSCAFGIEAKSLKNPNSEFREAGRKLVELDLMGSLRFALSIMAPDILKFFKICSFNPEDTNFFYKIVEETVMYREVNSIQRQDLMDLLIRLKHNENIDDEVKSKLVNSPQGKDGNGLTLNQIAAEVFLFYLAGFETTANAISFAMYYLAKNEDIQDKVREEILQVLHENEGDVNYEALTNMCYTEKVIFETLRMQPPIEMLNRICTQCFKVPNSELEIEEGTRIVIATRAIHYDPEFYPSPEIFDPNRFNEEEKAKRPAFTFLPFGEGPRLCLGYKFAIIEMKLALCVFLKNHKYSLDSRTKSKIETISNGNLLGIKDKIILKVKKNV